MERLPGVYTACLLLLLFSPVFPAEVDCLPMSRTLTLIHQKARGGWEERSDGADGGARCGIPGPFFMA